ncbi:GIY-YIG nuclease family protein [Candidatus Microgenomates bacterium]|nr:GIY-YIG nuclease family protein [Candidatus Microgenomates bacterium]
MSYYFVYAIKSLKDRRIYVGISRDPNKRLKEHNGGDTKSTKGYSPWVLIFIKYIGSRIEARKEEKRLKSGYGKEFLKSIPCSSMVERLPVTGQLPEVIQVEKRGEFGEVPKG